MSELNEFSRLIGALYDAPLDDARWRDVTMMIADFFDTHSCALQVRSEQGALLLGSTDNVSPDLARQYAEYYYQYDEWAREATLYPLDTVYFGNEIVADSVLERSECYDFMRAADMAQVVGGALALGGNEVGIIGVHRGWHAAAFDGTDRRKMQLLFPHLQRALAMRSAFRRHEIRRSMTEAALDKLAIAVLLVDRAGRIIHSNRAAVEMLRRENGLFASSSFVRAASPATTQALLRLIDRACNAGTQPSINEPVGALAIERAGMRPLSVLVAPIRRDDAAVASSERIAMLIVRAPEENDARRNDTLRALFGFTATEAALAGALADGLTLSDIAARHRVTLNTVRSQLKAVLRKSDTAKQSELVALVLRQTTGYMP
ncbi:helix-turn-helix transcriptional regulator [Burkholderia pseudomultivorans]|uniref:HTH luxR-type domain-containing protein n=1 Tax=Burkholderia pseudomultivorans TaxID=1207504 RepID=A0A132F0D8_9BURK|nr:hypothetical protein [Burkholderia pseudomultivorans]KWF65512.1 hypothetical protein WT57_18445 [Burkholderia pseudomultivorans]